MADVGRLARRSGAGSVTCFVFVPAQMLTEEVIGRKRVEDHDCEMWPLKRCLGGVIAVRGGCYALCGHTVVAVRVEEEGERDDGNWYYM